MKKEKIYSRIDTIFSTSYSGWISFQIEHCIITEIYFGKGHFLTERQALELTEQVVRFYVDKREMNIEPERRTIKN